MDSPTVIAFPRSDAGAISPDDLGAAALAEIDAAIALVVRHAARRVRLTAVPFVETVAAVGLGISLLFLLSQRRRRILAARHSRPQVVS